MNGGLFGPPSALSLQAATFALSAPSFVAGAPGTGFVTRAS